jgi:acyl-CoA dehydrogenase
MVAQPCETELHDAFDEAAFLGEVRALLDPALTPDLRRAGRETIGVHSAIGASRLWHRRLFERGWIAPSWPVAHGGCGWSAGQRFLFDRECARNDAPVLSASGIRALGPLLIEQGTPAQRARYLPAILSGADLWCQGFSEPGAGSDLAAITTRAMRDGDVYRVTGTKIWTTGAHHSNRMFAIVRTRDTGRRQEGITFLLIDMDSPGLTVTPIPGLAGDHEFNQVFFDEVRVPVANRVGAEDDGWSVAKRLMALARSNNTPPVLVRRVLMRTARNMAAIRERLEPSLFARLAALQIELDAYEQLELRSLPTGRADATDPATPSMLKLIGTELHQKVAELAMEAEGPFAAVALASVEGLAGHDPLLEQGAHATAKHFCVRAATVYSGTSETHRDLIAGRLRDCTGQRTR